MNDELSEKIANVQNFIVTQEFTTMELLVLVGFLQSQTYEHLQESVNSVKDR